MKLHIKDVYKEILVTTEKYICIKIQKQVCKSVKLSRLFFF